MDTIFLHKKDNNKFRILEDLKKNEFLDILVVSILKNCIIRIYQTSLINIMIFF
jgi:hypothetical protein